MTTLRADDGIATTRSFWLGVAAYLLPTFPIAYVWHLVLFASAYEALGIYRPIQSFPLASPPWSYRVSSFPGPIRASFRGAVVPYSSRGWRTGSHSRPCHGRSPPWPSPRKIP